MSTIAAGTTSTTGLVQTSDTTGNLVLQVNGTTPSLTLNTAGAHGVGSSPSYGTSGQVLTSAGSAASPTWATPAVTAPAGSTGQVQYNNAGAFGAVSSGTSGQVLTSAGTGTPTWSTPSAGAMTLISSLTSGFIWTGLSGYSSYLIVFGSTQGTNNPQVQIGYGTTPTYVTSGYNYAGVYGSSGATGFYTGGGGPQASFLLGNTNGGYGVSSGHFILNLAPTANLSIDGTWYNGGLGGMLSGAVSFTNPITAIKILNVGTNATFSLYGISS